MSESEAESTPAVRLEVRGKVLVITLNRPEARNAIDEAVTEGLLGALARLDDDPSLSVGVLAGEGSTFCAGMDLKAFAKSGPPRRIHLLFQGSVAKPLIGALEGPVLAGGLELALLCDLLVAGRGTKLGLPEVRVGLFAAGGGLVRLAGRLPLGTALEMALTGRPITAEEAHARGLVARLTEPGGALDEALELADVIARNAPLAVEATKALLRGASGKSEAEYWELQRPHLDAVFSSADAQEGSRAFAEKRSPDWQRR